MADKKGVDIEELLKKEEIDTLTYMGWEATKSPPGQPQIQDVSIDHVDILAMLILEFCKDSDIKLIIKSLNIGVEQCPN